MAKAKTRAQEFQELDEHITKDYDPEANVEESEHDSDSEVSDNENAGTEHYVSVGKSKLREKEGVSLGPQYRGARVTREALEQDSDEDDDEEEAEGSSDDEEEEFDDPETADLERDEADANDSEISSENAFGESDEERFKDFSFRGSSKPGSKGRAKQRATAADFMSSSEEEEQGGADVDEDEDDMSGVELDESEESDIDDGLDDLINGAADSDDESGEDEDDASEEEEDEDDDDDDDESESDDETTKKKEQAAKPVLAALSNRADVEKGLAIQQQRKLYDGLLNLRIRLQKALIAANTFPAIEDAPEAGSEPYEAAEEAAIKLLNTISSLKDNFGSSRAGEKRKRDLDASMASEEIWEQMQEEEQQSIKFREERLEKWSRKVQSVNVTAANGLGSRNKTLISALQEQLTNPDNRLAKRSRVPRSCAPAQVAAGVSEASDIYDDADFYQLLLKELVDQRTVESNNATSAVPSVMLTAAKETKLRKNVDRKASKGRKMRFTVHEKLQNFMAPEDRRAWEQEAIDRFFGTLFGRKMELNEDSSEDEMDVDAEEAGLRLFRS